MTSAPVANVASDFLRQQTNHALILDTSFHLIFLIPGYRRYFPIPKESKIKSQINKTGNNCRIKIL